MCFFSFFFFFKILDRGEGKEKERETALCACLSHVPYWGPGLQPRHVPCLGIEPATLWYTGWHSIHWHTSQGCLFVSWNRPVLLYIFLLELFWLHPIDCGSLCFHFHLSFDFFLDFVINPFVISSMLFSLHVFVCFLLVIDF